MRDLTRTHPAFSLTASLAIALAKESLARRGASPVPSRALGIGIASAKPEYLKMGTASGNGGKFISADPGYYTSLIPV